MFYQLLYNNAKWGAAFANQPMMKLIGRMSLKHQGEREKAETAVEKASTNGYYFDFIDLGGGPRPLKVNLSGFDFDPTQYDYYNDSEGYASKIIDGLRNEYINQLKDEPKDSFAYLLSQIGMAFKAKAANKELEDKTEDDDICSPSIPKP